jgi:oligopeptide/dipeptide ABC transporter ATP-binding protein
MEVADTVELFNSSHHPYSHSLIKAVPTLNTRAGDVKSIPGTPPNPLHRISGCPFRPRCPYSQKVCADVYPPFVEVAPGHLSACHFANTINFGNR